MREIKFRAWDKKEKMMWSADIDCFWSQIEVEGKDNHIIMQYTGLKDKNGTEIYEGDILSSANDSLIEVVEYSLKGCAVFHPLGNHDSSTYHEHTKVIGNIHENPELLKD